MNVLVGMYISVPARKWVGRFAYRAWTSVVFLLEAGIAKPSVSVKTNWTPRFSCAIRSLKILQNIWNIKNREAVWNN